MRVFIWVTVVVVLGVWTRAAGAELEDAFEMKIRGGLPNAGAKLERGEKLKVVFLGGSITRGGGRNGYVETTAAWLKQQWPNADITVINAGISGTDSNFGAKRYDRDVLAHNPDLVLIEFAVNDGNRDHTAHMERMVHKTWLKNPETDIAFFYTLSRTHLENYQQGKLPVAASCHERVAKHYRIPTIGLAHAVAAKVNSGEIAWERFANDAVHPHAEGYALFNEVFQRTLPALLAAGEPGPRERGEPITDNLQVYPEPVRVVPMVAAPFADKDGNNAIANWSVPTPAIHWIGEPEFQDDSGKTIWRLHWMDKKKSAAMDAGVGMDKNEWERNPMVWFEEDKCFTGVEGNALFRTKDGNRPSLGFAGREVAVLVFVAPATGSYTFRVGADRLTTWKNEDTDFAFNLATFSWGEKQGNSLVSYRARRRDINTFAIEEEVTMTAGEELAVFIATDSPGHIRGGWDNFRLDIGLMKKNN